MAVSGLSDVWAAGDIVTFPLNTFKDQRVNIGHWGLAMYHGKVAALNMLSIDVNLNTVPFFWTVQFGKSLRYAGHGAGWDSVIVERAEGEVRSLKPCQISETLKSVSAIILPRLSNPHNLGLDWTF